MKSIVNEPILDTETDENVSLRFLPGVLKVPGSATTSSNNVKGDPSTTVLKTSTADSGNHAGNIPKTPSSAPRLDRFVIKKKDSKSVKTEQAASSSGQENSSEGKEKEVNAQSRTVLSLSDKPADVSTESFLSSLSTAKPKEEATQTADATSRTAAPAGPERTTNASQDSVTESSCSVPKNESVSSPATTSKTPPSGILKKASTDKDTSDVQQPPVSTSETCQQPPAQPPQECKAVEDIQAITTISSAGKNEGLKPSRTPTFNPTVYNPPSQAPPPSPVFLSYRTGAPEHQYHTAPVHNYPPPPNPAPFIPVQPHPPPFTFPTGHPPIQIFHQSDLQSRTIAPPWPHTVPPQTPTGPPPTYETQRLPESSLPASSSVSKDEKESGKYHGDKPSRRSDETYRNDRDLHDRHHNKSRHHDRDREKHRERSHSHKDRHPKDDRYERPRERHHSSSHHRDRDKHKRDSDYDKHKRDSRDRRS